MRRLAGRLAGLLATPGPSAAVALGAEAVDAVEVTWNGGGPARLPTNNWASRTSQP